MKTKKFKVGDLVRIIKIPPDPPDPAGIDTASVFKQALGKTFRVEGVNDYGHLELIVNKRRSSPTKCQSDTIWIEPEFVAPV